MHNYILFFQDIFYQDEVCVCVFKLVAFFEALREETLEEDEA